MVEKKKARLTGFTLIELLIVLAIVATLLTIAAPRYYASLERSKEAVLKENLYQCATPSKYTATRAITPSRSGTRDGQIPPGPLDPITGATAVLVPHLTAEDRRLRRKERRARQGDQWHGVRTW
jgi:general secretion pathway protein G